MSELASSSGPELASSSGLKPGPSSGPESGPPPGPELGEPVRRSPRPLAAARARVGVLADLVSDQAVRHVFLKQFRDAEDGELAVLQQVVEARSSVTPGSLRWRRLPGTYDLSVEQLASHPLQDELGLVADQTIRWAFVAEFGFRMEPGVVRWP